MARTYPAHSHFDRLWADRHSQRVHVFANGHVFDRAERREGLRACVRVMRTERREMQEDGVTHSLLLLPPHPKVAKRCPWGWLAVCTCGWENPAPLRATKKRERKAWYLHKQEVTPC